MRAGDCWTVVYSSVGRLLGPRQVLYEASHRDPIYAAWDVMARVIRACRDEEEGLRAGRSAAQWLKANRPPPDDGADDFDDHGSGDDEDSDRSDEPPPDDA